MPREYTVGEFAAGFRIKKVLPAATASLCYQVEDAVGQLFFLKCSMDITPWYSWLEEYDDYQKDIHNLATAGSNPLVFPLIQSGLLPEGVERKKADCYFQVFQWLPDCRTLQDIIESTDTDWEDRLTFSRVFAFGLSQLHDRKIIHCDLKPPNAVIQETVLPDGKKLPLLRIADLDKSLIQDRKAPFWDDIGVCGTPGYFSPEHARPDDICYASDVYTASLILLQHLTDSENPDANLEVPPARSISEWESLAAPKLRGPIGSDGKTQEVVSGLKQCLHPDPFQRLTAKQLHQLLMPEAKPKYSIILRSAGKEYGTNLPELKVSADFSEQHFQHEDRKFLGAPQFIIRLEKEKWRLYPVKETKNTTIINDLVIDRPQILKSGDKLHVGSRDPSKPDIRKHLIEIEIND